MQIVAAEHTQHVLPLRARWQSAAGTMAARPLSLLILRTDSGLAGYGECAPLPSHGTEDLAAAIHALDHWCQGARGRTPEALLAALQPAGNCPTPAARSAIECALLDLLAQAAGVPLAQFLTPGAPPAVDVNAVAGALVDCTPSDILAQAAAGFSVIKLKLGVGGFETEMDRLRDGCRALPATVRLRLDVNGAWDAATAHRFCTLARDLPIESLEEPLQTPSHKTLRGLQEVAAFPIAIDESWRTLDADAVLADPPVRRLTLKLATAGGPLPALALARQARAAGIACVVTTGIDGACGTLAAAHLAAALDDGLAHGLATSTWLETDIGSPPAIAGGRLRLPLRSGIGFAPTSGATRSASGLPATG